MATIDALLSVVVSFNVFMDFTWCMTALYRATFGMIDDDDCSKILLLFFGWQKQAPTPAASQPPPVATKPQAAPKPQVAAKPQKGRQAEVAEPAAATAAAPQMVGYPFWPSVFSSVCFYSHCNEYVYSPENRQRSKTQHKSKKAKQKRKKYSNCKISRYSRH